MPSGLTHLLLVRYHNHNNPAIKELLDATKPYLEVGSVGPDLPYASLADSDFLTTQSELADNFHYRRTNQVPLLALRDIKKSFKGDLTQEQIKEKDAHFAFFAGYASHVIADGIFHPFVRDKVGEYKDHEADHRALELGLDVLMLGHLTESSGQAFDLQYSNIEDRFAGFNDKPYAKSILERFSDIIDEVYTCEHSANDIAGWVSGLYRLFKVSSSGVWPGWCANLVSSYLCGSLAELTEKKNDYLVLTKPKHWDDNFLKTSQIHFIEDGVQRFNGIFHDFLDKAYAAIYEGGVMLTESNLPAVDLDTGRPIYIKPTYWS